LGVISSKPSTLEDLRGHKKSIRLNEHFICKAATVDQNKFTSIEVDRYHQVCQMQPEFRDLYKNRKFVEVIDRVTLKQVVQAVCV
jgi:hypothetical protein